MGRLLVVTLVLYGQLAAAWAQRSGLEARAESTRRVVLQWPAGLGAVELWRCSSPGASPQDTLPRCRVYRGGEHRFADDTVASGTDYHYQLVAGGKGVASVQLAVPAERLPACGQPELRVDKGHYVLEVWCQKRLCKRYPVALGRDPRKRKLCFDNASTPEGCYRIVGRQSPATYYRAFDLDYPSPVDVARHRLLDPQSPIGGEIQVHGQGIARNWTFGCVAMRNEDIDELFAQPAIGNGTPVRIYGGELSLEDVLGRGPAGWSPERLGQFQQAHGLKVTCLWDRETRRVMKPRA